MWIATQDGLERMRPDERGFEHVPLHVDGRHADSFGSTRALFADAGGRLWIGAESGIYVREPDGTIRKVPVDRGFLGDAGKSWRIDGGHGETRVAVTGGLLIIGADGIARPLANRQLASRRIMSSTRDVLGRLWIGTADGVFLDGGHGDLQLIQGQPLLPGGLPGDKTWQTMLDAEGGLWITFDNSVIGYLPPGWNGFARFTHIPDDPRSLAGIAASTIHLGHDGALWVGGDNGWVDRLDATSGRVQHVLQGMHGQVVAITEDPRGRVWIDDPPLLHVLDHGKLSSIELGHARVTRPVLVCAGDDGRIYVASWSQGLFQVDPDSLVISPVPSEPADDNALLPDQIVFHDGAVWYASAGGLQRMDKQSGTLRFVPGTPRREILFLSFDDDAGFWLATMSVIEHYRYRNGIAVRDDSIDYRTELAGSDLSGMQVDRQGHLWIFANPGLREFDRHTRRFKAFGPAQGLSNANFSSGENPLGPHGTMFAANSGGVVAFAPERLLQSATSSPRPPVTLAYLNVLRHGQVQDLPLDSNPLQLGWRDRGLRVGVRFASYINPVANHYRFWLHGFDTDWVNADNRGERDFAGLDAGQYTLEMQATGSNGEWSRLATPLRIQMQAPPWTRWWAWLAYALLLLLVIG
ncbi:MAG TPA: triple tyrosine motif-containing protein, partial [Rhodanobacter sp.]